MPVLAGQSFTAVRMLNLGAEAGGTTGELRAMAWALFAFWRINYDHTKRLAYHTLHETLDMASNFGVPYSMLDRGADLADYGPGTLLKTRAVARRWASLALQDALAEYTWLCEDLARSPAVTEPAWASEPPPGTWSV